MVEPDDKKSDTMENKNKSVNETEIENNIKSWNENNINTLLSWISISSFNIACLEDATIIYRNYIRYNIILGLVLSTSAGTLSVTQYSSYFHTDMQFIFNMLFTLLTFTISLSTGYIKIYQIQERLEKFITLKQEWIVFITSIATEFQLPINLRKNALHLIQTNKAKYLDLLKSDDEIPEGVKKIVTKRFRDSKMRYSKLFHPALEIGAFALSITDILMNIGYIEGKNVMKFRNLKKGENDDDGANSGGPSVSGSIPIETDAPRFLRQIREIQDNHKSVNLADLSIDEYLKNNYVNNISRHNSFCIPPKQEETVNTQSNENVPFYQMFFTNNRQNKPNVNGNILDDANIKNEIRLNIHDEVESEVDKITSEIMRSMQYKNNILLEDLSHKYNDKLKTVDSVIQIYEEKVKAYDELQNELKKTDSITSSYSSVGSKNIIHLDNIYMHDSKKENKNNIQMDNPMNHYSNRLTEPKNNTTNNKTLHMLELEKNTESSLPSEQSISTNESFEREQPNIGLELTDII
jgi:hypothetical protein